MIDFINIVHGLLLNDLCVFIKKLWGLKNLFNALNLERNQSVSGEGLDQYMWSNVPGAPLHLLQVGSTSAYMHTNLALDQCSPRS